MLLCGSNRLTMISRVTHSKSKPILLQRWSAIRNGLPVQAAVLNRLFALILPACVSLNKLTVCPIGRTCRKDPLVLFLCVLKNTEWIWTRAQAWSLLQPSDVLFKRSYLSVSFSFRCSILIFHLDIPGAIEVSHPVHYNPPGFESWAIVGYLLTSSTNSG